MLTGIPMDRIEKLQKKLAEQSIDCALVLYHRDVFYYAGTARPAALAVTPEDQVLFARRGFELARAESAVKEVREGGLSAIIEYIGERGLERGRLALEMDIVSATMYLRLREVFPDSEMVDVSPLLLEQRMIKDAEEIESIRGACRMVEEAHRNLPGIARTGMTELELAAELERIVRLEGHETFAILRKRMETEMGYALVLSGASTKTMGGYGQVVTGNGLSSAFPYGPSRKKLEEGEVIVFDIAGLHGGYHSDLARTYFLGRAPARLLDAHKALVSIQQAMLEEARPGVPVAKIYQTARERARDLGWEDYFQGRGKEQATFAGHGLGLEVDEPPLLSPKDPTVLEENMTFTTELFIIHPDFGEAKLEDTLVVTSDGTEFLTRLERKVFEIEPSIYQISDSR
jgi:Xaa-Pro dipeptidase